jgi:cyclic pyranopterin phosphate synthase
MPKTAEVHFLHQSEILTPTELLTLLHHVFIPLGFTRIRLTGGELLVRPDVVEIVQEIARLPQVQDLAITTNGYFLASLAEHLYQAGLRRINISLDSLLPETFDQMIGNRG